MSRRSIPPSIAAVIEGIRWPLDPNSSPRLHYLPLDKMQELRRNAPLADGATPEAATMAQTVVETVALLATPGGNQEDQHCARVATALLLLGHGYTDEAHSLVSPLSFPQAVPFGYGPPVATNAVASAIASYAHSLVHRREGTHESEFNLTGFGNAHYWTSATVKDGQEEIEALLATVRQAVLTTVAQQQQQYAESKAVQSWVDKNIIKGVVTWEPRMLHELCESVMKVNPTTGSNKSLFDFAEKIAEIELRVLVGYTLEQLGYDCGDCLRS